MANPIYDIPYEVWRLTPEDEELVARQKKTRRSRKGLDPETVQTGLGRSAAARVYAAAPEVFAWPIPTWLLKDATDHAWRDDNTPPEFFKNWFTSTLKRLSGEAEFERRRTAGDLGPDLEYERGKVGLRPNPEREANPAPVDGALAARLKF